MINDYRLSFNAMQLVGCISITGSGWLDVFTTRPTTTTMRQARRRHRKRKEQSLVMLLISLTTATTTTNCLTITTFNILAPVHRSMKGECDDENDSGSGSAVKQLLPLQQQQRRESEREDWWLPRAESVAKYIAAKFVFSDIILLQEWWFDEKFTAVFDLALGDAFERAAERRPGADIGTIRDDGMCCLVRRKGNLELLHSENIVTGPQRIAQIIHCKERCSYAGEDGRHVFIANTHLSFPGNADPTMNNMRQAMEARRIVDALTSAGNEWDDASSSSSSENEWLEVICGDFNSNSCGLAASILESPPHNFVNCASATAEQMLTHIGGQVNIGVTHCNHLGENVSVDHIFLRSVQTKSRQSNSVSSSSGDDINRCSALALGYLDTKGTRILHVRSDNIQLEGRSVLSDHRPVTAKIAWPRSTKPRKEVLSSELYANATWPLDPLEPVWGIIVDERDAR